MSSRGRRHNDGDWTCPECNNLNFARRMQCNRCGVERRYEAKRVKKGGIEIGKSAAEKSRGLFSAEDWMCKSCGNVNWARRNECNICNTPKINIQEERTGYGGGFNERDGVEYKEKEDSDGEYDEFGRKKKKFRGKIPSTGAVVANEKTDANNEDNDDDDDSEDDEDVSKYDLEADDDDDDDDDEGDASKYDLAASDDGSSSSRSRSSSSSSDRKNGTSSSRSRSRSGSRRRRSRSSSNDSRDRHNHRRRNKSRSRSRSRSRSPLHRGKQSPNHERRSSRH